MHLLFTPLIVLEAAVFIVALISFALALRFFVASRKKLEGLLPDRKARRAYFGIGIDRDGFLVPTNRQKVIRADRNAAPADTEETKHEIKELRQMLQLQQLELTRALRKIEDLNAAKPDSDFDDDRYEEDADDEEAEFSPTQEALAAEDLREQLTDKEAELRELRRQAELNDQLATQFIELQNNYAGLQQKVQKMEQQSREAAETAALLEDLQIELEQRQADLLKKDEKLRELAAENGRLNQLLTQTEANLSEAAQQRQMLVKRLHFLEEVNADIQQMSDTNRKLKSELRRVGELESMLNLITEERDVLLMRKRG